MPDESSPDDQDKKAENCEETVEKLTEENEQLRKSSQAFGDLAERLNARARKRQQGADK